jgi:tetratricopeptide (TPR) repeat protein
MGLPERLGRALHGVSRARDRSTAAMLFRRADQCRNEGRFHEAARLVAEGLRQAPDSIVGHLISAYLHVARRQPGRARREFDRVLALDPYHLRALVGLARICIEDQDHEGAAALLDRTLQYYPDFPEARTLRETLGDRSRTPRGLRETPHEEPHAQTGERDVLAMSADGDLVLARTDDKERGEQLARHLMTVCRTASVTLSRAGLGSLRRAAIDTGASTTFVLKEADLVFSATLDGTVEIGAGFLRVGRLRAELGART